MTEEIRRPEFLSKPNRSEVKTAESAVTYENSAKGEYVSPLALLNDSLGDAGDSDSDNEDNEDNEELLQSVREKLEGLGGDS